MSSISNQAGYNIFSEAQEFVRQWDDEEWELDFQRASTFMITTGDKKTVTSASNWLAMCIPRVKQLTSAHNIFVKFPLFGNAETARNAIMQMNDAALDLINLKELLRTHGLLTPFLKYKQLEDEIRKIKADYQKTQQSEEKFKRNLLDLEKKYTRLTNRIRKEMGESGEDYIAETIADTDANVWQSTLEESDDGDKNG